MRLSVIISGILIIVAFQCANAQVIQNFNQSTNQIGSCWWNENMEITTKNTINKANEKKALVGSTPTGSPAYFFSSPLLQMNGTGVIQFNHKLTSNSGTDRVLNLFIMNRDETYKLNIYSYIYIQGGINPNGPPTQTVSVSLPITLTGEFFLRWEFSGVGGNSLGMVDDIYIDAIDLSDGTNDNGYGYCRADDEVWDTVCAGELAVHKVPYAIQASTWQWDFMPGAGVGLLDSSVVTGAKDTMVEVNWSYGASGDYQMEATEIRPPYNTTTYSVLFHVHVLPPPTVSLNITSVCPGDTAVAKILLSGNGPWEVTYEVDDSLFQRQLSIDSLLLNLPNASSSQEVEILQVEDINGCTGDPALYPTLSPLVYPPPGAGPIYH